MLYIHKYGDLCICNSCIKRWESNMNDGCFLYSLAGAAAAEAAAVVVDAAITFETAAASICVWRIYEVFGYNLGGADCIGFHMEV